MKLDSFLLDEQTLRVIDVGARGRFHKLFLPVAGKTEMTGFEPEPDEYERLTSLLRTMPWRSAELLPHAVGETKAGREFYVARQPALSSLLRPNRSFLGPGWDTVRTIKVDTVGLDTLYEQGNLGGRYDFLKVDVQGADLEVIRSGAKHILPNLLGIETEANLRDHYLTQPLLSEIELHLRESGFELVSLVAHHSPPDWNAEIANQLGRSRQRVNWTDAVFLRGRKWLSGLDEQRRLLVLPRLAVIYMLYGLYEEAVVLTADLDPQISARILRYYEQAARSLWRWRLGVIKRALSCALNPSRQNRSRLARHAVTFQDHADHHVWKLIDIHL